MPIQFLCGPVREENALRYKIDLSGAKVGLNASYTHTERQSRRL